MVRIKRYEINEELIIPEIKDLDRLTEQELSRATEETAENLIDVRISRGFAYLLIREGDTDLEL